MAEPTMTLVKKSLMEEVRATNDWRVLKGILAVYKKIADKRCEKYND